MKVFFRKRRKEKLSKTIISNPPLNLNLGICSRLKNSMRKALNNERSSI
jgi:hypothetical protein